MELFLRSDAILVDPEQAQQWESVVVLKQYFQVATVTVLAYDTITTLDSEVKYFWNTPLTTANLVYFVNRYAGLLGAIAYLLYNSQSATPEICNFAIWTTNIAICITIILIDYILMIRVLALYSQERMLSLFLKPLLALAAVFKIGITVYVTLSVNIVVGDLAERMTVCGIDNFLPLQWGILGWVIPMVYGVILMSLAIYKATEYWRISAGLKGFALVKVLVYDQFIYFMLVIACSMFNIMDFKLKVSSDFLSNVLESLGNPSFLCVLGSRLLVNLKKAGEQGINGGTSYRMTSRSISEMEFA